MSEELLPCPKGCKDGHRIFQEGKLFRIQCTCGWSTPLLNKKRDAINFWNTRTPSTNAGLVPLDEEEVSRYISAVYNSLQIWPTQARIDCEHGK